MEQRLTLHIVDGDSRNRAELAHMAFELGHHAEVYSDITEIAHHPPREGVLLVRDDDERHGSLEQVFAQLSSAGIWLPVLASGPANGTLPVVEAVKAGALDYLRLPADPAKLAGMLERIDGEARLQSEARRRMFEARERIANLSAREREVLDALADGNSNKAIARTLDISPRTVEIHRANMMVKLGAKHAAEAVRLRIEAQIDPSMPNPARGGPGRA